MLGRSKYGVPYSPTGATYWFSFTLRSFKKTDICDIKDSNTNLENFIQLA